MNTTATAAEPVATCAGAAVLPDHLSWSGIQTYSQCPRKFHYRYIVQAPAEFTPASLAFGGAFHRAAERLHQARIEGAVAGSSCRAGAANLLRCAPAHSAHSANITHLF